MTPSAPYPNDSLRWVAAEVKFPPAADLPSGAPDGFRDLLRNRFPVLEEQTQVALTVGPAGPTAQQTPQHRFVRRDRLQSATLSRDTITLEATDYRGWTDFSEVLLEVLHGLEQTRRPDGITRVGLRYIDEVRIPDPPATFDGWRGWVDDRLVAPFTLDDPGRLANGTVVLQYGQPPGYMTIFRAAPFASGRTVQPEGPLRMPIATPEGPYFLLDTDASWVDPDRQVPEFSADKIAEVLAELHAPCKRLFEASITDRLREEVLRQPRPAVV